MATSAYSKGLGLRVLNLLPPLGLLLVLMAAAILTSSSVNEGTTVGAAREAQSRSSFPVRLEYEEVLAVDGEVLQRDSYVLMLESWDSWTSALVKIEGLDGEGSWGPLYQGQVGYTVRYEDGRYESGWLEDASNELATDPSIDHVVAGFPRNAEGVEQGEVERGGSMSPSRLMRQRLAAPEKAGEGWTEIASSQLDANDAVQRIAPEADLQESTQSFDCGATRACGDPARLVRKDVVFDASTDVPLELLLQHADGMSEELVVTSWQEL